MERIFSVVVLLADLLLYNAKANIASLDKNREFAYKSFSVCLHMKLVFSKKFFLAFTALFFTEISIAIFVHDQFVRPFVGDVLVILLMYAFVRAFFDVRSYRLLAVCILLIAYMIELGQYFELVARLGLTDSRIATTIIGTSFDWKDILAYTIGFGLILLVSRTKE